MLDRLNLDEQRKGLLDEFYDIEEKLLYNISSELEQGASPEDASDKYMHWYSVQEKLLQEKYASDPYMRRLFNKLNAKVVELLAAYIAYGEDEEAAYIQEKKKDAVSVGLAATLLFASEQIKKAIEDVSNALIKAEAAALKMIDFKREAIVSATEDRLSDNKTLYEAIDEAMHTFIEGGLNCVEYDDGRRVDFFSYVSMLIMTGSENAVMTGEGIARAKYNMPLVIIKRRMGACPFCVPYLGKVCIDDVWSMGKPDGKHPLMSEFIAGGLYHPNCKDSHKTYIEGVDEPEDGLSTEEQAKSIERYNLEQRYNYNQRHIRKFERLMHCALSEEDRQRYESKMKQWEDTQKTFISRNIFLKDNDTIPK